MKQTTVLALGCFDLLHPGHIEHLKAAKKLGTRLEVGVTVDRFVNKGPGRPLFTVEERIRALQQLRCVSHSFPSLSAVESIELVRPDIYVKGLEYEDQDIPELDVCRKLNVRVMFLDTTPVYSSTKIMTGEMLSARIASA